VKYIFLILILLNSAWATGERACCGGAWIYDKVNKLYRRVNKDLMATEVLIKMYNDETLHTIDIANNRIDEKKGVDYFEADVLDKEIASSHLFYQADPLPEKYDLNQIVKIAVIRSIWHDKIINASLDKSVELSQEEIIEGIKESELINSELIDELIGLSEILRGMDE
jgi:hypothetical protein